MLQGARAADEHAQSKKRASMEPSRLALRDKLAEAAGQPLKRKATAPTASAPSTSEPWFGSGNPQPNLSATGAGVGLAPPLADSDSSSDSPPESRPLRKRAASAAPEQPASQPASLGQPAPLSQGDVVAHECAVSLQTDPVSPSAVAHVELSKKDQQQLDDCTHLYASEGLDGYHGPGGIYVACKMHKNLEVEFGGALDPHEVIISFPAHFGKKYPFLFAETNGRPASLYRTAANALYKRDGREGTQHHLNSPSKLVARPGHAARRDKKALVRMRGTKMKDLIQEHTDKLLSPSPNKSWELMALGQAGTWKACTAKVSKKRIAAMGKKLPAGKMWIRWQNHYVTAISINRVADIEGSLLGSSLSPLGA